jgi:hypothetical protein
MSWVVPKLGLNVGNRTSAVLTLIFRTQKKEEEKEKEMEHRKGK